MAAIYSDLAGKVVLVTGGASGIGAAIVRALCAAEIDRRCSSTSRPSAGAALARELTRRASRRIFMHVDLTDIAALRAGDRAGARKRTGRSTILINNAAHDERHRDRDRHAGLLGRPHRREPEAPVLRRAGGAART